MKEGERHNENGVERKWQKDKRAKRRDREREREEEERGDKEGTK